MIFHLELRADAIHSFFSPVASQKNGSFDVNECLDKIKSVINTEYIISVRSPELEVCPTCRFVKEFCGLGVSSLILEFDSLL